MKVGKVDGPNLMSSLPHTGNVRGERGKERRRMRGVKMEKGIELE